MSNKNSRVKNHTIGDMRYLTWWVQFPDGVVWVQQTPLYGPIDSLIHSKKMLKAKPGVIERLLKDGIAEIKTNNGVVEKFKIEDKERQKVWGVKRR